MRKTAQQRLNEFFNESDKTRHVIRQFNEASYRKNQSYAYAAGYLESFAAELIMQLPKAKRDEYRAQLAKATAKSTVD